MLGSHQNGFRLAEEPRQPCLPFDSQYLFLPMCRFDAAYSPKMILIPHASAAFALRTSNVIGCTHRKLLGAAARTSTPRYAIEHRALENRSIDVIMRWIRTLRDAGALKAFGRPQNRPAVRDNLLVAPPGSHLCRYRVSFRARALSGPENSRLSRPLHTRV